MPLVVPEASCHPADLLVAPPLQKPDRLWYVAHTMARQEKSLARDLLVRDIPYYLPLLPRRLSYRGRSAISYHPLFAGFVFVFVNADERRACLATGRVATLLDVADQDSLRQDLVRIAAAVDGGLNVMSSEQVPDKPQQVRVTAGPLAGMEGAISTTVHEHRTVHCFTLPIGCLKQHVAVELQQSQWEPLGRTVALARN